MTSGAGGHWRAWNGENEGVESGLVSGSSRGWESRHAESACTGTGLPRKEFLEQHAEPKFRVGGSGATGLDVGEEAPSSVASLLVSQELGESELEEV